MILKQLDGCNLTVGIGVHYGKVIEGIVGSKTSKIIMVNGDPVNTCARICNAALPGELLISDEACKALSISTKNHTSQSIIAKGKKAPMKVYSFSQKDSSISYIMRNP